MREFILPLSGYTVLTAIQRFQAAREAYEEESLRRIVVQGSSHSHCIACTAWIIMIMKQTRFLFSPRKKSRCLCCFRSTSVDCVFQQPSTQCAIRDTSHSVHLGSLEIFCSKVRAPERPLSTNELATSTGCLLLAFRLHLVS